MNHISQSPSNGIKSNPKSKDTKKTRKPKQLETILLFLQHGIYSTSQLSKDTGIPKSNICRYVVDICEHLVFFGRFRDPLTGYMATFYTLSSSENKFDPAVDFTSNLDYHE